MFGRKAANKNSKSQKKSNNIVTTHVSVPKGFFDMEEEEQLEFVTRLLEGLNPHRKDSK